MNADKKMISAVASAQVIFFVHDSYSFLIKRINIVYWARRGSSVARRALMLGLLIEK